MAFANLFSSLAAVKEDEKRPVQPVLPDGKETGNGKKRENKGGRTGSFEKKPRCQTQTTRTDGATSFKDYNHQAKRHQSAFHEYADAGFSNKVSHSHTHQTELFNASYKGQNTKTRNERNVNQQKKNWERQKHRQEDGRGAAYRRWGPQRAWGEYRKYRNEDSKVKPTRFMSQEFKDKNAISVGDRLLCKHFLRGSCVKGDECKLEHAESCNDLLKESCKYYIQGTCTKGESCPYMHNSFPCKFFHRRGKCNQEENCRFSHEPLSELTNKLLDEAIQRENDLIELSKKAEQELSGQPVNSGQPENPEETKTPDVLLQPLRPSFYQSVEIKAEEKSEEELTENSEEAVTPHAAQPHGAPAANLDQKEPVCYSVETVLGPQLSKPFPSFFAAPGSQYLAPLCSSDNTPAPASDKSSAPYSVDAVLKSYKSAGTPTPQTVSYSQKSGFKGSTDHSLETQNEKSCYSVNTRNEGNKFQGKLFQSLPSFQTHSTLTPNSRSDLTLPSGEHRRHVGNLQESLKPEVKFEPLDVQKSSEIRDSRNLQTDTRRSVDFNGRGVTRFGPHTHKTVSSSSSGRTSSTSDHPVQPKPHLSVMMPHSRAPFKPFTLSSSKFKGKDTVSNPVKSSDSADDVGYLTKKQPAKETAADCSSKKADAHLAGGCKLKTSFHGLFAKPITDSLQRKDALTSSFSPRGLNQSPFPSPKSAALKTDSLKTVEPDKPPTRSFVSLFAAPLSAASLPSLQPQGDPSRTSSALQKPGVKVEAAPRFSDSEQRAAGVQTQRRETVDVQTSLRVEGICRVPTSSHSSPEPEIGNKGSSTDCEDQMTDRVCSPNSTSLSEGSTPRDIIESTTRTDHSVPDISPCKDAGDLQGSSSLFTSSHLLRGSRCVNPQTSRHV